MIIPSVVNVGPFEITVEFLPIVAMGTSLAYGTFSGQKQRIEIEDDLNELQTAEVFLHEILHAIADQFGLDAVDENVINKLSPVLLDTIRRNKLDFLSKEFDHEE